MINDKYYIISTFNKSIGVIKKSDLLSHIDPRELAKALKAYYKTENIRIKIVDYDKDINATVVELWFRQEPIKTVYLTEVECFSSVLSPNKVQLHFAKSVRCFVF